jgi:WD40 repeat protein
VSAAQEIWRHDVGDFPEALAVSSQGELAVGLAEGGVSIREFGTGQESLRLSGHKGGLLGLDWHPRNRMLATSGQDGHVRLWRLDKPDEPTELVAAGGWVQEVAWSPDGKLLASAAGKRVQIWKADGRLQGTSPELPSAATGLAWNRKSKKLYVGAFGGIRMIDPAQAKVTRTLKWQGAPLTVKLSPDERHLAAGLQDGTVHFWRLTGGDDSEMRGFPNKPKCVSWSSDGAWLAHTGAPVVLAWPFDGKGPEGRTPLQLEAHTDATTAVAWAPEVPLLASGGRDALVLLWSPTSDEPLGSVRMDKAIDRLAWAPARSDGLTLYASDTRGNVARIDCLNGR